MVQVEDMAKLSEEEPHKSEKSTLLSKYRIPLNHLEFDYVEKCNDGKELEKILKILTSGEEGYFPHLVEATEKRLAMIKPNSKLLRTVCPVLKSSDISQDEWSGLSKELREWVYDVNKKDHELEERKIKLSSEIVDADIRKTTDKQITPTVKPNPKRIKSTDYESWDKYDPDTEILKMDLEDEKFKKQALESHKETKQAIKKNKTVRFNNFATEAEAIFEANREKERGNECFKAGEFQTALQHYSNSLQCKPLAVVFTNRALTYNKLKKYEMAISDCNLALKLEPDNFKAYLRMAQAYDALEQYDKAYENVEVAIEIDPNNTVAQQLANRVRKECGKTINNKRFSIQDVDSINKSNAKPLKPILKSAENTSKINIPKKGYEVLAIPGTSKMPPPYYKVVHSSNPEVIKREKLKILNKPHLLHMTTIDLASDDDLEINKDIKNNENIVKVEKLENFRFKDEETVNTKWVQSKSVQAKKSLQQEVKQHLDKKAEVKQSNNDKENIKSEEKPCNNGHEDNKTITKPPNNNEDNKKAEEKSCNINEDKKTEGTLRNNDKEDNSKAGGDPCNNEYDEDIIPTAEELQSPFTFIETWNSIRKDTTYKKQAELLRRLNLETIHQVIGYKLDDTMLNSIINCLHKHFMVPNELDRLHATLINITQIPRFSMMLMFLSQADWQCINQLIQFLNQHGRDLPTNVRNTYTNK